MAASVTQGQRIFSMERDGKRGSCGRGRAGYVRQSVGRRGRGGNGATSGVAGPTMSVGRGLGRGLVPLSDQAKAAEKPRRIFPTSLKRLQDLLMKDNRELVLTLQDVNFGFSELLNSRHLSYDFISAVIALLEKAIKCDNCPRNLLALLNNVLSSELFTMHIPRYLTTAPHDSVELKLDRVRVVIENLVDVFDELLQRFPNKASEVLGIALLTVRDAISRYDNSTRPLQKALVDKVDKLEQLRAENISKYKSDMRERMSAAESEHARLPPSNFRSMDIFPTQADIHETLHPFLRANLVRGHYNDVDHYLDVHFRLMREDFVAPLRDGLTKYLALMNRGKGAEVQHQKYLRVYCDVRIVTMEVSPNDGLLHLISFDVSKLQKVRWEFSKRLMYGSLLCISGDNFRSFQLGIVVKRDAKLLSEGYVYITLVGERNARIAPNVVHVLAESPAYFEAYSPILRGLQTMNENSMPFKQYFIDATTNLGAPRYLLEQSMYDFGPLTKTPYVERFCKVLPPYNDEDVQGWPLPEDLQLDLAQYSALRTCLTKEVAVVQGPPGTGKTFLGLKVVEMLLKNREVWSNEAAKPPILIVCHTNHALDQFLEGILRFHPHGLVRIGGQSKMAAMEPHNLASLRRIATQERGLPVYVYANRKQLFEELHTIQDEVTEQMDVLKLSESRILHEDALRSSMSTAHYQQLQYGQQFNLDERRTHKHSSGIVAWLNLTNVNFELHGIVQPEENRLDSEEVGTFLLDVDDVMAEDEMARRIEDNYFDNDDEKHFLARRGRRQPSFFKAPFAQYANFGPSVDADGFQVQGGSKKIKKLVQREMKKVSMMTNAEVNWVRNVHQLASNDRWRLYRHWISKLRQQKMDLVRNLHIEYERTHLRLKEVLRELDVGIVRNATVVGVTTTGAAKNRELLQIIAPKIVIIEEAAEVLEAHVITALSGHCEHLILIGDQQQLRPNPTVYRLAKEYMLDVSLFERLIGNGLPYERLILQHRMRPRISKLLVPHIYKDLHDHPSVQQYPHVKGFVHDVFFVSHSHVETTVSDTSSRANGFEAHFLLATCRHLLLQGYKPEQITMLATYLGQVFLIKQLKTDTIAKDVRCTVVDNFQGEENDIILLSLVRSNADGKVGFLKVDNRVCVALSRAKIGLVCIGNFEFLAENAGIWKGIIDSMRMDGLVGSKLKLRCGNHPNVITEVVTSKDFNVVAEGGCDLPCEYRLLCGHQCPKLCHVYDEDHKEMKCMKPCNKDLCELGHKCKKLCKDECGACMVEVAKMNPLCGHENQVACYRNVSSVICRQPCKKMLICSHMCAKVCGELCCDSDCNVEVAVSALCGHAVLAPCSVAGKESQLMTFCKEPCIETLPCGHLCAGSCHTCKQGRMHIRCKAKCGRILICGHPCDVPCARNCPPCQRKCETRCEHSKCPLMCGVPCTPCQEPCTWGCEHLKCTKHCKEPCNRPPCNEPCPKKLKCGHPCIGFCGEPCPEMCRVCDHDEVCAIFFGTEDEEDARFVLLVDCGHIVESSGMDYFMGLRNEANLAEEGSGHELIDMKQCPKCKTVIRRTLRYMTIINQVFGDVITIKRKFFGEANQQMKLVANLKTVLRQLPVELMEGGLCHGISKVLNLTKHLGHLSLTDVRNLTNMVTISLAMNREYHLTESHMSRSDMSTVRTRLEELQTWFVYRLEKQSSDKEILDFTREFQRIRMLSSLVRKVDCKTLNPDAKAYYDRALFQLAGVHPFTEFVENETHDLMAEMEKKQTGLCISDVERIEIISALKMAKGHFYKCPNGHIYVVTECGGPMQVGECPECGAAIGGMNHRLLGNNQLANEMDGATAPAYPTALMGRRYF